MQLHLCQPTIPTTGDGARAVRAGALLLLLATAGVAEQWDLLTAAATLVGYPVDVEDLDPLVAAGLVIHRSPGLALNDERTTALLLEGATPAKLKAAHLAWARTLSRNLMAWAHHEAFATDVHDAEAARRAAAAASRFQSAGRHDAAVQLFRRAAGLSPSPSDGAVHAVQGAACAYAAGLQELADELTAVARQLETDPEIGRALDILQASFRAREDGYETDAERFRTARLLCGWGQPAAAFVVLTPAVGPDVAGAPVAGTDPAGVRAIAALTTMRDGRVSTALPQLRRAAEDLELHGEHGAAVVAYAMAGETAMCLGHTPLAPELLDRADRLMAKTGLSAWKTRVGLARALQCARRGQLDARAATAVENAMLSTSAPDRARAEMVHAVGLLAQEQWNDAFDVLSALVSPSGRVTAQLMPWGLLSHLADAAVHSGRESEARLLVSRLNGIDGLLDDDIALAELMYATAVLSEGGYVDACFEAMLAHDPRRWPWLRARTHLAYGRVLRRRRRVLEARGHLVTARRLFAAMDVPTWERRATGELRAAGSRERPQATAEPASLPLSPQELQIARLAARGLTNREIGQSMHLSPRTIGSHLYRIFPKLNLTSRTQLARLLADGGVNES